MFLIRQVFFSWKVRFYKKTLRRDRPAEDGENGKTFLNIYEIKREAAAPAPRMEIAKGKGS